MWKVGVFRFSQRWEGFHLDGRIGLMGFGLGQEPPRQARADQQGQHAGHEPDDAQALGLALQGLAAQLERNRNRKPAQRLQGWHHDGR